VVILNGNISLLCVGLMAEIGNIQNKTVHIFVSSQVKVEVLESYREGLGNLQNKLDPTPFI
jgi:hypothetical protein